MNTLILILAAIGAALLPGFIIVICALYCDRIGRETNLEKERKFWAERDPNYNE